jgi:hypothetical protein
MCDELKMMADAGCTASISPDIELQMGHGWPATGRLISAGIRPISARTCCTFLREFTGQPEQPGGPGHFGEIRIEKSVPKSRMPAAFISSRRTPASDTT